MPTRQITSWSQQEGTQTPSIYSLAYDPADQLVSASVSEGGNVVKTFGYSYDPASNRLTEQVDATTRQFSYNALNQLTSVEGDASPAATYQWDAEDRLISVTSGNENTELTYDGLGRRVGIRFLVNGAEVSDRRFVWCDNEICEERTPAGIVLKRYFPQGVKIEGGATPGKYFYTMDHLGSVRELIDDIGSVRARFNYNPYGVQSQISGDLETDFGFTGHFYHAGIGLDLTWFRAYDPKLARWLSRDPLPSAETLIGPNLYSYVSNNPINELDFDGRGDLTYGFCVAACVAAGGNRFVCAARCYSEKFKPDPLPPPPPTPEPQAPPSRPPRNGGPYRNVIIVCGIIILIIILPVPKIPVPV